MDNFNENMKVGTTGETLVINQLETFCKGFYRDLRSDPYCKMVDVDFAFILPDRIIPFDVKTDNTFCPSKGHYNVPYQLTTAGKVGAGFFSQADYFYFVSTQSNEGLWVNVKMWNDWIKSNRYNLKVIPFNVLGGGEGILCDSRMLISAEVAKYQALPHIDYVNGNKELYKYIRQTYIN